MIEAISQWLQQIILLVLIASILDMLLPSTLIQRYVKFVMSLLILLSMISPVMQWVKQDLTAEKMYLQMRKLNGATYEKEWDNLKQYSEKLLHENDQETTQFVQDQLQALIKAKAEEEYGVGVEQVIVSFEQKNNEEQSYPVISSVQLIMDKDKQKTGEEKQSDERDIEPVEPVTIDLSGHWVATSDETSTLPEPSASERKVLAELVQDIATTWSIDHSKITATIKGKEGER